MPDPRLSYPNIPAPYDLVPSSFLQSPDLYEATTNVLGPMMDIIYVGE